MTNPLQPSFSNDKYRFLSNFWNFETPMVYGGNTDRFETLYFKTSEAFYMAMKTKDYNIRKEISLCGTGSEAKRVGRSLELRPDWEDIKFDVMLYALRYKFSEANPTLRKKLLATGDSYLQEANWWGDVIGGVCMKTGEGENNLGRLLMQVRDEIREEISNGET